MEKIILTNGMSVLVDKTDYEYLSQFKWYYQNDGSARRTIVQKRVNGKQPHYNISMHREIMGFPKGLFVDHINRNRLDNRKTNLRICTRSENARNRGLNKNNKTGYKGVTIQKNGKYKYINAYIKVDGIRKHIGNYKTIYEAASAYNKAAIKYHKNFASLNNMEEQ